ncbi:cyclophilin-like fold protein [Parabacteroides bouchesdurhonensis]|uniref:cyclophilin-like fold protein n=1 Tax=Parabacteroides bouchesdurhonensis TaxID=1936995 RepID=UPI000E4B5179|nr:cyclophilin-like fold protein [Parabacteroides bouchesdurhonensis]RHJ95119.1 hypothetical protein DW095_01470 [Bacteroides sp. AM07-16]
MKKILLIPFLLFAALSMSACGSGSGEPLTPEQPEQPENPGGSDDNPDTPTPGGNGRYLVLFASRSGNTERMANEIREQLDCDILEVEPEVAYDNDYNAMLERSQEELAAIRQGNYPPVKTSVESFDDYDIVFVGYPIWYGSMATPMQTFLHTHASKLAGKRIALFATSGSSGISSSVSEARNLCPGATIIEETLLLTSSTLSQMVTRVPAWLEEIGASREEPDEPDTPDATSLKVNIMVGSRTITATMEDNAAARDFLSRLPLEVTLNDYNNTTEKIFYPDPALTTEGVTRGCAPTPGDITIYAPWGNVAIFCKSWSHSNDLIKIGHIDGDGIGTLNVGGDITVKFERQ